MRRDLPCRWQTCIAPLGACFTTNRRKNLMNQIIYIVGAVVIVLALLSFVGLR
ncbi:hypothetical protein [Pseudotabrizicola sediminis]|uniref:hypothetical protein n=1 Tax=Pseudotabrizicola sediminis TaxID=2486418 RepID=UPI001436ACE4|nr:hypothetical protein [Pseudotabrizicola sediminis]